MRRERKKHQSKDLDAYSLSLLRLIIGKCLRAQGLPSDDMHIAGILELIDAGFVEVQSKGGKYWLEAL